MSVEPSELMSEVWTRWQGQVINGVFPLGRYLGCSDHSGVFLTRSAARPTAEIAIKLVPADRALTESQLPRWRRAGRLAHAHLLPLLEWGGCQLEGLPYLYAVMEYADQTLAQLLLHRALTEDEAREMLLPTLDALTFLHERKLLQGQLKPANILVVGDQLKLSSDTVRRASEERISASALTVYDPPEARHGSSSAAGDIWGLGVTLFEALTRPPPSTLAEHRQALTLPADFPPAFHEMVARCLSPRPDDRPSAAELVAWVHGRGPLPAAVGAAQPVVQPEEVLAAPEAAIAEPAIFEAPPQAAPEVAQPASPAADSPKLLASLGVVLGLLAILALGWIGVRFWRSPHTPAPPPAAVQPRGGSPAAGSSATPPATAAVVPPVSAAPAISDRGDPGAQTSAVHEVIPEVTASARHSIHGHIKVWVRVIVDRSGAVFAASMDRPGPSRYFQRQAIEAARKWTFPQVDSPSRRLVQLRFDFARDGTTARAVPLD